MTHKLTQRQYKRLLGIADEAQLQQLLQEFETLAATTDCPPLAARALRGFRQFFTQVDEAYVQSDRDLDLGKRSLELSSQELGQANETLRVDADQRRQLLNTLRQTANDALGQLGRQLSDDDASLEGLSQQLSILVNELLTTRNELQEAMADLGKQQFALDQHAIVSITDTKGTLIYANEKFCTISQYSPQELLGKNHRIVNSGLHSKDFFQAMWSTILSGKVWHGQIRNVAKDGSFYWTNATIVPLLDEDQQPYQFISIRTDVTEEFALREKIESSQALLQNVMNTLGEGVYTVDAEGLCTFINPEAQNILGWQLNDIVGQKLDALLQPVAAEGDAGTALAAQISLHLAAGKVFRSDLTFLRHKTGKTFPAAIVISPIFEEGKIVGAVGAFQNISARLATDQALRESEMKQRMLLDNAADAVFVAGADEKCTYANDLVLSLLGYRREELIGSSIHDLFVDERADPTELKFMRQLMQSQRLRAEVRLVTKQEHTVPVELNAALLPDGSIYCSCRDITERLEFESALIKAKDGAEAANKAKSQFLATMSHEIRTPMNGIIGMTELALDTPLQPQQREYLELVKLSSDALLAIINDILDFSKIESEKITLEKIDFPIRDLLASSLKALAVKANEKKLELVYQIDPAIPDILIGDPGRIRQIVTNLVGNAIKFSEAGEVVLEVRLVASHDNQVDLFFAVRDHGIGIPHDKQASIFQAFSQADASTTRKYGGTGLGLTISSRLVQRMHGKLEVQSEPGKGSSFFFTLCLGVGIGTETMLAPASLHGLRVLIVDDNAINRHFFEDTLIAWGMRPQSAENAEEALRQLDVAAEQQHPFELVLLDICMPETGGFELAEQLRHADGSYEQKIIMLSSAGAYEHACRCREVGIHDYVSKPVSQSELFHAISAVMSGIDRHVLPSPSVTEPDIRPLQPLKILVVEDNSVNQKLVISLLEKWGHASTTAENGLVAIEQISHQLFDLVLMDMQMPLMGGIEATTYIRQLERDAKRQNRIPIIAMTANAMPGDWERCLEAGMDHYLSKPIKAASLKELLDQYQLQVFQGTMMTNSRLQSEIKAAEAGDFSGYDYQTALLRADREIVQIIAHSFLQTCQQQVEEMRTAIATLDAELLHRAAHTLKGLVANFCAEPPETIAYALEQKGKLGDFSQTPELFRQFVTELEKMNQALRQFMADTPPE
ncbi:response regulator [Undibacterium rugosum]|uniref:Sensory/regulatory protein RpfC n=1 Tax=Undibacterium rugosum TaxID=2762291 RepID=A0A923I6T1_9BURK|nr:response regulator [Undibacterium rugosum]MBC3934618.1 response regulator [Undibacterium rugosum]MBR7777232.1 response regulator [Undibacterium rugosum]